MGWIGWTDRELKRIPPYYRSGMHAGRNSHYKTPKIRMDYPNCYFRRLSKKEIEEQNNDF